MPGAMMEPDAAASSPTAVNQLTPARAARMGLVTSLPVVLGSFPFGLVTGALAADVGLTPVEAVGMSVLVFAGAGQVTALGLYAGGAPAWLAAAASIVVNLRFVMYSAAMAPIFRPLSLWRKCLYAYVLTDQAYVLSVDHYQRRGFPLLEGTFYLALSAAIWVSWVAGTLLGAVFGAVLEPGGGLDFVIPLIFISLLVPALRDRPAVAAAVTSGTVTLLAYRLPLNLGLLAATLAGIAAGLAAERGRQR